MNISRIGREYGISNSYNIPSKDVMPLESGHVRNESKHRESCARNRAKRKSRRR